MAKISKRVVDAAKEGAKDYFIWDEALAGFGVRVLASGKRSYLIQYRSGGRARRCSIGAHGVWTPEAARNEAKRLLGRVAQGEDPAEDRRLDRSAITMKELCERYVADLKAGLILGKGGRPKKPTTMVTDQSRIDRHILPLIGTRRVKDLTRADVQRLLMDVMAGRTRRDAKTKKLRGRSIVRGGVGTATRTVSLLGGILTYAKDLGIIATNPVHGVRKPKDGVRTRRPSEDEYRTLGSILREKEADPNFQTTVEIIRDIALTGARRGEIIGLKWADVDFDGSCLRLSDSKEGASVRPIGLKMIERLDARRNDEVGVYVFPGPRRPDTAFSAFQKRWEKILRGTALEGLTAHVLRHSFASIANDLGFTEITIAGIIGHARGTVTSKYIHHLDSALIMATDTVSGYIHGLLEGVEFKLIACSVDRTARGAALDRFLKAAVNPTTTGADCVHEDLQNVA